MDEADLEEETKPNRARTIRRGLVVALVLLCASGLVYTRCLAKKSTLGEPCSYDMHCRAEAPRCMKTTEEQDGVCSRSCDKDDDCLPGIRCIKVGLDEYDDRGRPKEGGYCFPQSLLDARKQKRANEAGTDAKKSIDSVIEIPEAPGQLEAEITLERGGAETTVEVKGTLLRTSAGQRRTLVDTTTLRVFTVDDEKKTFSATQIAAAPGEPKIVKTDRKDKVAEHACDVWRIEDGKTMREVCVVPGGAFIDATRGATAWEKELAVRSVFALRVSDGDGKAKTTATKMQVHTIDAARFAIPRAYKNLAAR